MPSIEPLLSSRIIVRLPAEFLARLDPLSTIQPFQALHAYVAAETKRHDLKLGQCVVSPPTYGALLSAAKAWLKARALPIELVDTFAVPKVERGIVNGSVLVLLAEGSR